MENKRLGELLVAAKKALLEASRILRVAREVSPGDMLTRNAFLMSIKTYDLTVESLQRNAPAKANQPEVSSLYNSSYDDED